MSIHSINCKGKLLDLSSPKIMGVLNVTPDSFYDGGKYLASKDAYDHIASMVQHGVDIIDVGAVSSRPGSTPPALEVEIERLIPVIDFISKEFPTIFISVDTYRADALQAAADHGADIANDISAGSLDDQYLAKVSSLGLPYILMHMQGTPMDMQDKPSYKDVVHEVIKFMVNKISFLKQLGIEEVILDPGFGFGKSIAHNYQLLSNMGAFKFLELPIMSGTSNKSMIYRPLSIEADGIISANAILYYEALRQGASILRVHRIAEGAEAIKIFKLIDQAR